LRDARGGTVWGKGSWRAPSRGAGERPPGGQTAGDWRRGSITPSIPLLQDGAGRSSVLDTPSLKKSPSTHMVPSRTRREGRIPNKTIIESAIQPLQPKDLAPLSECLASFAFLSCWPDCSPLYGPSGSHLTFLRRLPPRDGSGRASVVLCGRYMPRNGPDFRNPGPLVGGLHRSRLDSYHARHSEGSQHAYDVFTHPPPQLSHGGTVERDLGCHQPRTTPAQALGQGHPARGNHVLRSCPSREEIAKDPQKFALDITTRILVRVRVCYGLATYTEYCFSPFSVSRIRCGSGPLAGPSAAFIQLSVKPAHRFHISRHDNDRKITTYLGNEPRGIVRRASIPIPRGRHVGEPYVKARDKPLR
jgi:hypothetical protein